MQAASGVHCAPHIRRDALQRRIHAPAIDTARPAAAAARPRPRSSTDRRTSEWRAPAPMQSLEPRLPAGTRALALPSRRPAASAHRAAHRHSRPTGQASSRTCRDRLRVEPSRTRPRSADRASGVQPPPACGAPRAARRRDTRRDAHPSISCARGEGCGRSRVSTASRPASMACSSAISPSTSIASCRQSCSVCRTSG